MIDQPPQDVAAALDAATVDPLGSMAGDATQELGRSRDRALARSAGAALISRGIVTGALALSLAVTAKHVPSDELGVIAVLTSLLVFLGFGDFGLGTLVMSRLPAAHARGDAEAEREIVSGILSTLLGIGAVIFVVGGLSAMVAPWQSLLGAHDLPADEVRSAVIVFFAAGGLGVPAALGSRILAGLQRSDVVHAWNAAIGLTGLSLTIVAAALDLPMWVYVAAGTAPLSVLGAVQTVWVLSRRYRYLRPRRLRLSLRDTLGLLRDGFSYAIISLSAVLSFSIDTLVVSSIRGADDAAIFSVTLRLFALIGGTLNLAGQQMWSALADALARGDVAWARRRFRHVLVITGAINLVASAGLVVVGPTVVRLWVGQDLVPSRALLLTVAIWTVYSTTLFQGAYVLAAVERVQVLAVAGLASAPINIALSIAFTRWIGLPGPPIGSLIAVTLLLVPPTVWLTREELRRAEARAVAKAVAPDPAGPAVWAHTRLLATRVPTPPGGSAAGR